jgi:hypothetical protein
MYASTAGVYQRMQMKQSQSNEESDLLAQTINQNMEQKDISNAEQDST